MGSMPEVIAKGSILRKLEMVLNNRPNRETIWNALQASTPILTIARDPAHHVNLTQGTAGEEEHIQQHWLTDPNWLAQPAEPIARKALIEALQRAMNPDTGDPPPPRPPAQQLDIDFYWVCHPGHGDGGTAPPASPERLEVSISWNANQVTVIFYTPEPVNPPPPGDNLEDIVIVKEGPEVVPVHW